MPQYSRITKEAAQPRRAGNLAYWDPNKVGYHLGGVISDGAFTQPAKRLTPDVGALHTKSLQHRVELERYPLGAAAHRTKGSCVINPE